METITVSQNVLNHLRYQIVTGNFIPGQKLNELDLASTLSVSTAPIREAIRLLQNEHLVKKIPRKGTFVTEISVEDCRQIYEVRKMIECSCIDILKSRNTTKLSTDIMKKPDAHDELLNALTREKKYFPGLAKFHFRFCRLAGNAWLTRLYESITSAIIRYQLIICEPGYTKSFEQEHKRLIELIENGNFNQAKKSLKNHIDNNFGLIADKIRKGQY